MTVTGGEPKKILVVDDENVILVALKQLLEASGYQVDVATDGKIGLQALLLGKFDLVLSDIRMPNKNGIELLHAIKKNKPTPVILMTGFSEINETAEAYSLGADGFLAKPFKKEDLLQLITQCFGKGLAQSSEDIGDQYCKLNIEDFISGSQLHSDIFIQLSDSKYIKIAHQGDDLSSEQIIDYKKRNIKFLYMRKTDFAKYVGFNIAVTQAAGKASWVSKDKKLNLIKHTGEIIQQRIRFEGLDPSGYEYAKTFVESAVTMLSEDEDAFNLLSILESHTDFLYAHSIAVGMISTLIARQMQWNSISNFFKVTMGGLLHDIGKKEIEASILSKLRKDLTASEIKLLETHPIRGLEILSQLRSIPDDVVYIASQHHETCCGHGYPSGLKRSKIHLLARLVSVANEFCNLVMKVPNSPGLAPQDAVRRLMSFSWERLDPDVLLALGKLFKIVPTPKG